MTLKCEGGHLDQPVECVASALRVLHLAHAFDRIKLRTGNKLLADKVRSLGYENGRQESNGELVGRFIYDAGDTITTLRASLAAATAREGRLREALENIAEGSIECVGRYQEDAMQKYARAAIKETTP